MDQETYRALVKVMYMFREGILPHMDNGGEEAEKRVNEWIGEVAKDMETKCEGYDCGMTCEFQCNN